MLHWSEDLNEIQRLSLRKEELYREVVKDWGIEPLPGVRRWLERLREGESRVELALLRRRRT